MNQFEEIENIEAYFEDRLSTQEKTKFEEKYAHDHDFRLAVETYRKTVKFLEPDDDSTRKELREQLNRSLPVQSPVAKSKILTIGAIVAIAASLLLFFLWKGQYSDQEVDLAELATQFEIEEPGIPVLMGNNDEKMRDAMILFQKRDYAAASQNLLQQSRNDTVEYFLGVSFSEIGNLPEAYDHFTSVIELHSDFLPDSYYRRALVSLKQENKENALKDLQALLSLPVSSYHSLADSLVHEIEGNQ